MWISSYWGLLIRSTLWSIFDSVSPALNYDTAFFRKQIRMLWENMSFAVRSTVLHAGVDLPMFYAKVGIVSWCANIWTLSTTANSCSRQYITHSRSSKYNGWQTRTKSLLMHTSYCSAELSKQMFQPSALLFFTICISQTTPAFVLREKTPV